MHVLPHDRYLAALETEARAFAEVVRDADLRRTVPTCPDWDLGELTAHLGGAYHWVAALVRAGAPEGPPGRPPDGSDPLEWLLAGAVEAVAALRTAGPDAQVWAFVGEHRAGFWARRMVHETAVHRYDAALTAEIQYILDPAIAADGISEGLTLLTSPEAAVGKPELVGLRGTGEVLHLHATDDGLGEAGEWIIERTPDGPVWTPGHRKGDVAVRGPAADLLLVLYRRRPAETVEVLGDRALLDHWLELARF